MKGKWMVLILVFSGLFAASFTSFKIYSSRQACPVCAMREGRMSCCDNDDFLCKKLGMNADQAQSLKKVDKAFDKQKEGLYAKMDEDRKKIAGLLGEKKVRSTALRSAVGALDQDRGALEDAALQHVLEVKGVLDPQQQEQFLAMINEQILR